MKVPYIIQPSVGMETRLFNLFRLTIDYQDPNPVGFSGVQTSPFFGQPTSALSSRRMEVGTRLVSRIVLQCGEWS
jgi:hypothetical protein